MLVNLTRFVRYWDDLSVTQLLVRRMGHLKKDRVVCVGFLILSPKTVPNVSVYRPDSPVSGAIGCLEKLPLQVIVI